MGSLGPTRNISGIYHVIKRKGLPKIGRLTNPDVAVDTATGEVYPINVNGELGDSIGNIYDHIKKFR
jgi:hypothetical protein